jgi:hypothetical protein
MLQELPCLGEFLGVSAFSKSVFFTNYKLVKPMLEHRAGIPSAGAPTTLIRSDSSPSEAVSGGTTSAVATRSTSGARLRGSVGGSATLVGPNRRAPTGSASPGLLTGSPDGSTKSSVGLRAPRVLFIDTAACLPVEGRYTALPPSRSTDGKDTCRCELIAYVLGALLGLGWIRRTNSQPTGAARLSVGTRREGGSLRR